MASKKTRTKYQPKPKETKATSSSVQVMRVIFLVLSVMIVLSMILAAMANF